MNKPAKLNPEVNFFFEKTSPWQKAYQKLRGIVLDCGLREELKWGVPCYTVRNSNVVLIHGFKEYCALLFHKGVLLRDSRNILIQQTENVQAARQIRFADLAEIEALEPVLKEYIREAVEVEKAGLQVPMKTTSEFAVPEELEEKFARDPDFLAAFEALTPGRQRAYLLYFAQAKQAKTREARIEKYVPKILDGRGLND